MRAEDAIAGPEDIFV